MTIPNRTVSIKSVFASTANTTIPTPPATGVSYRNTGTTAAEIGEGWPFKEVVDSAKFNQAMYEYTTICQQLEKYGFLPWSVNTDYAAKGCALGSDGKIYQAKQATGPSSTSIDPTTDTSHTYWDLFYYADVTANRALVSNANGKMAASSVTANELGYLSGVTSSIQTQINNKANNNAVVHLTGDETIDGNKTFSGVGTFTNYNTFWKTPYNIIVKSTSIEDGVTPSSNQYMGIEFRDKNDVRVGWIGLAKKTDGTQQIELQKQGSTSGFIAPTPTAGDNSTNIATTAFVQTAVSNVLASLYPVGSIYIGTQNTCPLASLISGSTWQLVAQNRALWGGNGSNGNSTINAGLPNIKGNFQSQCLHFPYDTPYTKGALYAEGLGDSYKQNGGGTDGANNVTIAFDASRSNSIYGASSTVQPPAYRVNVWRRIA